MFKLNIRVLLVVSVALLVLYSLVKVTSAEPARSLRLKPTSRSLRSRLETLTDPSKRQQGVVCENFYCMFGDNVYQCPDGCNSKFFFQIQNTN